MNPLKFIRVFMLDMTQKDFGQALGISQVRLSHVEANETIPPIFLERYRDQIKHLAVERGREPIKDEWFERTPSPAEL